MSIAEINFRWRQKCAALFSAARWTPRVGDYCTPRDPGLRLYRIEELGSGGMKLRLVFDPAVAVAPRDTPQVQPSDLVWVPDFVLGVGERDRPRIAEEARIATAPEEVEQDEPAEADTD